MMLGIPNFEPALGYTPENVANKQTALSASSTGYPNADAVIAGLALKLDASAYNEYFKGRYASLAALQTAHPTASDGDYAVVDTGTGIDAIQYIWDSPDGWVAGAPGAPSTTDALPEGSTNFYFTADRVRSTLLTGLSLASSAAITASSTAIEAWGQLQAQVSLRALISDMTSYVKTALNASGSAPVYALRTWADIATGSGSPVVSASGNISSVDDLGTGWWRINFSTNMSDTSYGVLVTGKYINNNTDNYGFQYSWHNKTLSSVEITSIYKDGTFADGVEISVAITR